MLVLVPREEPQARPSPTPITTTPPNIWASQTTRAVASNERLAYMSGPRPCETTASCDGWCLDSANTQAHTSLLRCNYRKRKRHQQYDVLLAPTLASEPVPVGYIGEAAPEDYADRLFSFMGDTGLYNQTGQPSISLPLHWSDNGLPVGIMFTAAYGSDALLLQLARQLEQAQPWWDRRPPLHAGNR